jgi:hypothetical protein
MSSRPIQVSAHKPELKESQIITPFHKFGRAFSLQVV